MRPDNLHYHYNVSADGQFNLNLSQNGQGRAIIPWTASAAIRTGTGAINRLAVEVLQQQVAQRN